MATFEDPSNGYKERVGLLSILWAALFGPAYYAFKGVWRHVVVYLLLAIGFGSWTFGIGAIPIWLMYTFLAPVMVTNNYKRRGWVKLTGDIKRERMREASTPSDEDLQDLRDLCVQLGTISQSAVSWIAPIIHKGRLYKEDCSDIARKIRTSGDPLSVDDKQKLGLPEATIFGAAYIEALTDDGRAVAETAALDLVTKAVNHVA